MRSQPRFRKGPARKSELRFPGIPREADRPVLTTEYLPADSELKQVNSFSQVSMDSW